MKLCNTVLTLFYSNTKCTGETKKVYYKKVYYQHAT